jgi:hypothetical protein
MYAITTSFQAIQQRMVHSRKKKKKNVRMASHSASLHVGPIFFAANFVVTKLTSPSHK